MPRKLKPFRIPAQWSDVDEAWINAAIKRDCPAAVVSKVSLLSSDDGTNRRARFALEYENGQGPEALFLKAHAASHRWVHFRNGNLFNEARLFASGVDLPLDHPRVYMSVCEYLRLDFLLVMEDLTKRGADPRDATRPMTVAQVASGLQGLARLHSQYWNQSHQRKLKFVKHWRPAQGWQVGLRKRIPIGLERGAALLPSSLSELGADAVVDLWVRYVAQLSRGPITLLHGDAHIGNTYVLPDNSVGFLDWQVVRWGSWSQDVGYFLQGSLTVEDRRKSERELLSIYRDALELPENEKPTLDEVWRDYCASSVYGLAIWLSTLGTDGWQSREISEALVRRYASACVELDAQGQLQLMEESQTWPPELTGKGNRQI